MSTIKVVNPNIYLAFNHTEGSEIQYQGETDMSVHLANTVSILEENKRNAH